MATSTKKGIMQIMKAINHFPAVPDSLTLGGTWSQAGSISICCLPPGPSIRSQVMDMSEEGLPCH